MRFQARVEASSNTSTVAWQVVGGDEKGITGSLCTLEGYKYGDLALQVGRVSDLDLRQEVYFVVRMCDYAFVFQVLELMKEVAEDEDDSSDISGYHSDSDSAIMMSGNSPYVSKRARYNFLSRSGKKLSLLSVCLCVPPNSSCSLRPEPYQGRPGGQFFLFCAVSG
jgi:hypothetical protein